MRFPSPHRQLFFSASIAATLLLAGAGPLWAQPGLDSLSDKPESEEVAATRSLADIEQAQAQLRSRRAIVERQLAEATQRKAPEWLASSFQFEVNQLKYHELLLSQQQVLLEDQAELEEQLVIAEQDPSQQILEDLDDQPPYSFLTLEQLRDSRADATARAEMFQLEIETARQLLRQAEDDAEARHKERRRLQATLQNSPESTERVRMERQVATLEQGCRLSSSMADLRTLEVAVKKLEKRLQDMHVEALGRVIQLVAERTYFDESDLETKLAQIDDQQSDFRRQLTRLQDRLNRREKAAYTPVSGAKPAADATAGDETRDLIRDAMGQLNESLADLVILRYVWKERYRFKNKLASDDEIDSLFDRLTNFQGHLKNARHALELKTKQARLRLPQIEAEENPSAAQTEEHRSLRELLKIGESRAVLLHQVELLVNRFHSELDHETKITSFSEGLEGAYATMQDWWSYEVIAVDERPITIGKIVTAALMLLGGWFLSRRLSRMLGKRMLPRLGIHDGASMALQTISFYTMVIICAFLTLDMLNIPLTVFTFLGGAAAIAVGFGSQNILNNFISGLILLGEQPIRVGDLVEIDGLHANIEHIGPRSTRVRTGANLEIIVPNSRFLENNVTNWTLSNDEIRTCVKVGVAYGSPVEQVLRLLQQAVDAEPQALTHPEPIILFNEFGDNSLNFEVHFWVHMRTLMQGRKVESNIRQRVDNLFRAANITIAFPQRDVHLDVTSPIQVALADTTSPAGQSIRRVA